MIPRGMLKIFSRYREEEARPCKVVKPRFREKDTLSLVALAQCSKVSLDRCRFFVKRGGLQKCGLSSDQAGSSRLMTISDVAFGGPRVPVKASCRRYYNVIIPASLRLTMSSHVRTSGTCLLARLHHEGSNSSLKR